MPRRNLQRRGTTSLQNWNGPEATSYRWNVKLSSGRQCYHSVPMSDAPSGSQKAEILRGVVTSLLTDLKNGTGDKDRRRQVEEWLRGLAEKYPEFAIESGLRDYYLAEAHRLRADFEKTTDIAEKLGLGRAIEAFLDRAAEYERRISER